MSEHINHPAHYGGDTTYEAIKVIEAWGLNFCIGNAVKYICRAGKKDSPTLQDLQKAQWYLSREIQRLGMVPALPQTTPRPRTERAAPRAPTDKLDWALGRILYAEGKPISAIATTLGCSGPTVAKQRDRHDWKRQPPPLADGLLHAAPGEPAGRPAREAALTLAAAKAPGAHQLAHLTLCPSCDKMTAVDPCSHCYSLLPRSLRTQ